jgi:hypothetical protein
MVLTLEIQEDDSVGEEDLKGEEEDHPRNFLVSRILTIFDRLAMMVIAFEII